MAEQQESPPKGPRTETVVRRYDADGVLVSEVVTVVTTVTPQAARPEPGCYP